MKKLVVCLIMLINIFQLSAQYRASFVDSTKDIVTIRCVGYGKKAALAAKDAELSAIKSILFIGITNTKYSTPLIEEEQLTVEAKFQKFFMDFYNKEYKNFIESSVIVVSYGKNALKQKSITLDVSIRAPQLRSYLEKKEIIRKFGL